MSALGHKQTFAVQNAMPALPPKADMYGALAHVRFVPIAARLKKWGRYQPPPFGFTKLGCLRQLIAGRSSR